jgi:hypothetical protein
MIVVRILSIHFHIVELQKRDNWPSVFGFALRALRDWTLRLPNLTKTVFAAVLNPGPSLMSKIFFFAARVAVILSMIGAG